MVRPNKSGNRLELSVRFMSHDLVRIADMTVPNICAKIFG
jgi:hypothetical protein